MKSGRIGAQNRDDRVNAALSRLLLRQGCGIGSGPRSLAAGEKQMRRLQAKLPGTPMSHNACSGMDFFLESGFLFSRCFNGSLQK